MKTKLFFVVFLACTCASAQLTVKENGKIAIQTSETPLSSLSIGGAGNASNSLSINTTHGGLYILRSGTPTLSNTWWNGGDITNIALPNKFNVGLRGAVTSSSPMNSGRAFGLYGMASNTTSGYNYGVYGVLGGEQYGAGIYGTVTQENYVPGRYAGFFNGDIRVTGYISGTLLTASVSETSVANQVMSLSSTATNSNQTVSDKLALLSAVQYSINNTQLSPTSIGTDTLSATMTNTMTTAEVEIMSRNHYGLLAAEVQQIYPDLVYENQQGELCINYIEMTPLLVQSIQELKAELSSIQNGGNSASPLSLTRSTTNVSEETLLIPTLEQNNPNPFTESTVIACTLPETVQTANIYIYDMNGTQIEQIPLTKRGETSVTVSGGQLSAGMYLYSLIADGKVIDTKRMILTK